MIPDSNTNFLYLADTLPVKYPAFFKELNNEISQQQIAFDFLPNTKDVWAVDYMPIQVTPDKFVQFVYNPDYLRNSKTGSKAISDVTAICKSIQVQTVKSSIVLDGGNVIRSASKVIMTEKVFAENPSYTKRDLIKELEDLFETDIILFIPTDPTDFTGHADGMVRFIDDDTVLINDYSKENSRFRNRIKSTIQNAGLNFIEIPYLPYSNKSEMDAKGIYINYLQMQSTLLIPVFGIKEDEAVAKQFESIFKGYSIATVASNDVAKDGGILNCISWNILK